MSVFKGQLIILFWMICMSANYLIFSFKKYIYTLLYKSITRLNQDNNESADLIIYIKGKYTPYLAHVEDLLYWVNFDKHMLVSRYI